MGVLGLAVRSLNTSRLTHSVLANQGTRFSDATSYQFNFNLELLVRPQINCSLEREITGKRDAHMVLSRGQEHCFSMPIEFFRMPGELLVDEYRRPLRCGSYFQFTSRVPRWRP
jgi:hypothetical protein